MYPLLETDEVTEDVVEVASSMHIVVTSYCGTCDSLSILFQFLIVSF